MLATALTSQTYAAIALLTVVGFASISRCGVMRAMITTDGVRQWG